MNKKEIIIKAIQRFYKENGRIPITNDFINTNGEYPGQSTVKKCFGSWNIAIEAAGFTISKRWDSPQIIEAIRNYVTRTGNLPKTRDFSKATINNPSPKTVNKHFGTWNNAIEAAGFIPNKRSKMKKIYHDCSESSCIEAIQRFYLKNKKIPHRKDFDGDIEFPSCTTLERVFGSWNKAIEAAGYTPNNQDGFGTRTTGLDGILYRSKAEAYFCDTYLYSKYTYDVEPKYPNSNWMYDWYIRELDLYIELDGEIRPERTKEKIEANKQLDRNCLFIKTKDIYKDDNLEELIQVMSLLPI